MNSIISSSLLLISCLFVLQSHATQYRIRRGAAYAGAYGSSTKLTPSVALGTFGGHLPSPHGAYRKQSVQESLGRYGRESYRKQTVQESLGAYGGHTGQHGGFQKQTVQQALGAYGGFVQGGHNGPNVLGNEGSLFNKGH